MDFEEANGQVNSLCGALPNDDITKVCHLLSFREKVHLLKSCTRLNVWTLCMLVTDNLSDPNQTSKMLVVIQIQTVRHTNGIGWYFKSRLASVLNKMIHQKNPNFPFKHSY